tara:strand:- start:3456 stop:3566 length:111 start_codon:yes stop_codon:yes gene_type:complete
MRKVLGYAAVLGALFFLYENFKKAQTRPTIKLIDDE